MKTLSGIATTLLLVVVVATSLNLSAQSTDEKVDKEKYHINIIRDENGNKQVIDKTFSTKEEMDAFIKENKLDIPDLPMLIDTAMSPGQSGNKKSKKIIIIEREEGSAGGKTDLDIAFENFSPEERAALIQEMLDKKDRKVEIKQLHTNSNFAQEKVTVLERGEGKTGSNTELDIDFSNFTPEERANLIQEMMGINGSQIEIRQTQNISMASEKEPSHGTTGLSGIEAVSNLQLFPNPNNGQFHISFNTRQPANVQLRMTDMSGKEIYNEIVKSNNSTFNKDITLPPAISAGSYVLEAVCNGQKITTQVVVQ